jgi:hypothetical protein
MFKVRGRRCGPFKTFNASRGSEFDVQGKIDGTELACFENSRKFKTRTLPLRLGV